MEARLILAMILWLFVYATTVESSVHEGSCKKANLCCHGRDSSCVVYNVPFAFDKSADHADDHPMERACYCDHACLKVGDCCPDFQDVCGAVDCEVSPWGAWSECSSECGMGAMTRERRVLRSSSNGGQTCPELTQKRSCYGNHCNGKSHVKANREMAMILPASYSTIRQLNATQDIRNNLRLRYQKDPAEENSKEYCVLFEVTKVRKTCENLGDEISSMLMVGAKVCTICETAAMRKHLGYRCQGHGDEHRSTTFTLLAFPQCHGRWKRLEVTDKCKCNTDTEKPDFIFV